MGLFDESDSDNDDPTPTAVAATNSTNGGGNNEEEEEDLLDAYMKSLDAAPAAASSTILEKNASTNGGGRLDVDAEDEATSHWEVASSSKSKLSNDGGARLLPKHDDGGEDDGGVSSSASSFFGGSKLHAQEARSAMSDTFIRAGGVKNQTSSNENPVDNDNEDDSFDNLQNVRKHQQQMLHQEVDPLERIDHKNIQYESFRRVFYTPSGTAAGQA